jgi:phosphoglycolate phosphatase
MAVVMYDLDGTLLDTAGEIAQAVNLTLAEFGHDTVSEEQVRDWIGHGTGWLMKTAWQNTQGPLDAPWDKVMERFVIHYDATAGTRSNAFPYVLETLRRAREHGVKQAIVTNKESRFTERVLERHGLNGVFDIVICGDSLPVKKPDPAVIEHCLAQLGASTGEALFVGDSAIDVSTARAAGVVCWAVPYGYNLGRPIEDAKPDRIVPDIREVPGFFRQL